MSFLFFTNQAGFLGNISGKLNELPCLVFRWTKPAVNSFALHKVKTPLCNHCYTSDLKIIKKSNVPRKETISWSLTLSIRFLKGLKALTYCSCLILISEFFRLTSSIYIILHLRHAFQELTGPEGCQSATSGLWRESLVLERPLQRECDIFIKTYHLILQLLSSQSRLANEDPVTQNTQQSGVITFVTGLKSYCV